MKKYILFLIISIALIGCMNSYNQLSEKEDNSDKNVGELHQEEPPVSEPLVSMALLQEDGETLLERFNPPKGYVRLSSPADSFADYLQNLPLKSHGEMVQYYDGKIKANPSIYEAVIQMDIGSKDLQQCADAIMRLRGEYLFHQQKENHIHFDLTNGFRVDFAKWMEGYRVKVNGNTTSWVKKADPSDTYETFRKYMDFVFMYAGTISLSQELSSVPIENMQIGDVFIVGGSPGHAVIVVDMAVKQSTGQKLYMLAQSYMPAQDIHILFNPNAPELSPWYELTDQEIIQTPEWSFEKTDLKRFMNESS